MKSNEEVERLLNENSEINNSKIIEMRDLMEKYQTEKRELEKKHSQSVLELEVRTFTLTFNNSKVMIHMLCHHFYLIRLVHCILFYGLNLI